MPKQIPDLKKKILYSTKEILFAEGYDAVSMRRTASACGIAVGTLYNYYSGKDELVAYAIMEDWEKILARMSGLVCTGENFTEGFTGLYHLLDEFVSEYSRVWERYLNGGDKTAGRQIYHSILQKQLTQMIEEIIRKTGNDKLQPLSVLLAETLLAAVMQQNISSDNVKMLAALLDREENSEKRIL